MLLEAAALLFRIIKLAKAVGDFQATDENFEALHPIGLIAPVLGQRRDGQREIVDDSRLNEMLLSHCFEKIGNGFARRLIRIVSNVRVVRVETLDQCAH